MSMSDRLKFGLKDLHLVTRAALHEVSGVDDPANQHALFALTKRAPNDNGDSEMNIEELTARLEKVEAERDALEVANKGLTEDAATAETRMKEMEEALKAADITLSTEDGQLVVKKAPAPDMIEIDGELVEKSSIPGPLLKRLEAQGEEIKKMRQERDEELVQKRASDLFPNLGGTLAQKGKLLAAIDKMDEADAEELVTALKAADAAAATIVAEKGVHELDENDPSSRLDALVKKYASENDTTYQIAYAEVTKRGEGRELRKQTMNSSN